ncbi:MAG: SusC/RagA family TonB-linked outer membrane protein [Balneolaceae bacterium]|nr:SusC/RagA family TonB-linked outer membrane protein [Balneolaceae bacterium]
MSVVMVCFLTAAGAYAQQSTIQGKITDSSSGEELPGANVFIQELSRGTATTSDGTFTIEEVPYGTYQFQISFVGYDTKTLSVTVDDPTETLNVTLVRSVQGLRDVVVTAFGLSREQKSIGYSVQEVSGDQVASVEQNNLVESLSGKVAGVQVIGASGASIGGSAKIRLRGSNGLSDGQPLFVVDGTPIENTSFSQWDRGRDFGSLVQDLNLQDIESVSVLKGAAASALYGNRASNGVILITTKKAEMGANQPIQIDFSNNTSFEKVSVLPEYQNQYGGGYTQSYIPFVDPEDGQTYNTLNYAADESWGPPMDGTMYRPWWSWFHGDFTGDGQDDYGTQIPMSPNPDNVRDFFDTGWNVSNNLAISGGSTNASYRVSLRDSHQKGIVPNSDLNKYFINFSGALSHSDKFTSKINFNYVNTKGEGRPAQGYSPVQGNPFQSFNQWFQRQLDMDKLRNYRLDSGQLTSWNIRSPVNLRPLYWDSPFFSVFENVPTDNRNRLFGNYQMSYRVNDNLELFGKVHADFYDLNIEDRIASGGLEEDWFKVEQYSSRELNFEAQAQYKRDFGDFSTNTLIGGNLRQDRFKRVFEETVGGLSTPDFYNIAASIDRPNVSNTTREKDVRSIFGTTSIGWKDMVYVEATLRNDWSSALPEDNNSYLYYGFSTSLVFTELSAFKNQNILSFGKIRASLAQVGEDVGPYNVFTTYNAQNPFGGNPALTVPNTLNNQNLKAAISSDYELGLDLRFLDGKLRLDANYFHSVREDEILNLQVPSASGYTQVTINAGEFTTEGFEFQLGSTVFQNQNWSVDLTANWANADPRVNRLAEGLEARQLERAYFGAFLFAEEGKEWGQLVTSGFTTDDQGRRVVSGGFYVPQPNKELGSIMPDFNGGFRADVSYKNFSLAAFVDFQKGGKFYSLTKMFNSYSGLGPETVGNNVLGNPLRDPVADQSGNTGLTTVLLGNAATNSGGVLVEGVDASGNPVQYLTEAQSYFGSLFFIKENWIYDASYVKLKEIKLTYNLPASLISKTPFKRASVAVDVNNAWLIYSSVDGLDPSIIQNGTTGFSFWEGANLPAVRSIGFNINVSL